MALHALLHESSRRWGSRPAVVDASGAGKLDFAALDQLSDRLRDRLVALEVGPGDRVGMYLRKSSDGIATIFGILKTGAAYVPVDPTAPAVRNAYIHANCSVKVVVIERRFVGAYKEELRKEGHVVPHTIVLEDVGGGVHLEKALAALDQISPAKVAQTVDSDGSDLAYILYTSGSTGKPKGVMLSHENAESFVQWCTDVFEPRPEDVFSSHAPFHFDLSILDIYVPLKGGASVVVIGESVSKEPLALSKLIEDFGITVWYSAPSILSLIAQFGKIPERDFSRLRTILFAGEVFPVVHLRSLKKQVPKPRYFNLYGPTETNVCTYYEVPELVEDERTDPYPIGKVCENLQAIVVDTDGSAVLAGQEGELCIAGPNVMQGYWSLPEQTAKGFLPPRQDGLRWYKTGDIVVEQPDGNYRYVGRRDRMVKRRGYRVELGEIEACLYRHPGIREAAVVALQDEVAGVKVKAHIGVSGGKKLSLIELKTFCSQHLPLYMVPDAFTYHEVLPKTSTDKIDYQSLKAMG
jgi:amino acid adenylation domain-containing protein